MKIYGFDGKGGESVYSTHIKCT